jgi:aminoglycoside phosphotransferase (APT) family kinase protein
VLTRLAIVTPEHHGRAGLLLERLMAGAPLPPRLAATLHNDLHTANVLVDPRGRVTLIDLDSLALGDPAWDLALFATRLWLVSLVRGERWEEVRRATELLREEYEREAAAVVPEPTWRWYLAATLLARQVKVCVRHGGPAATSLIGRLLDEAQALLDAEPAAELSAAGAGRRPVRG